MMRVACRSAIAAMLAVALVALVAGCATPVKPPKKAHAPRPAQVQRTSRAPAAPIDFADVQDSAPTTVPDVSHIPEPEPRDEPPSKYGNMSSYTVLGRTYRVMSQDAAKRYKERGLASWYGTKFHGRLTSNREPYDMYAYTGAHKTLPLPAYVRVRNLDNGRSLVLRVNDRGPFHPGRIIDLSYAAAIKLGVHLTGTARVEVETVGPRGRARWSRDTARREAAAAAAAEGAPGRNSRPRPQSQTGASRRAPATSVAESRWMVQVGSFASLANAHRLRTRLQDSGLGPVVIDAPDGAEVLHRVRIGPLSDDGDSAALERRLRDLGLRGVRVRLP